MVESVCPLGHGVVSNPGRIQQIQRQLKEVAEGRNCISVRAWARVVDCGIDEKAIETAENDIQEDEDEPNPFDDQLFFSAREQAN